MQMFNAERLTAPIFPLKSYTCQKIRHAFEHNLFIGGGVFVISGITVWFRRNHPVLGSTQGLRQKLNYNIGNNAARQRKSIYSNLIQGVLPCNFVLSWFIYDCLFQNLLALEFWKFVNWGFLVWQLICFQSISWLWKFTQGEYIYSLYLWL